MIAALYSSRDLGTKQFTLDNSSFGWKHNLLTCIKEKFLELKTMKYKEYHLLASHVLRDKWTRLNVKAAKIMQESHVISELKEYSDSHRNDRSLLSTIQYLEACSKNFENGLLSHDKISLGHRDVIESMENASCSLLAGVMMPF